MRITIVVPTYNEAKNVRRLMPLLQEQFLKAPHHTFTVLVVDGNSPDGTSDVVLELAKTYPFVQLLKEEKKTGLGGAYIYAFKHVLKSIPSDAVMEMDGDLQHNPAELLRLVEKFDEGYDYVIGSRFIKGGSIPKSWGIHRKFLSVGGNLFTQIILGAYGIHDFTSGFRLTRVQGVLDKLDLDHILSKGFSYKMDLLYQIQKLKVKVTEVPIEFCIREDGESKMERNNMFDTMRVVLTIKARESHSFFKFAATGVAGLSTDLLLFNLLRLVLPSSFASGASGIIAILVTYLLNNFWSFSHSKKRSILVLVRDFPVYAASSYVPIIFRSFLVHYVEGAFGNGFLFVNLAFMTGVTFGLVWNYTVYSRIIWKKAKHT